jgi:glycosyltransferase involved in cell wall biosynthesis
MKSVPDKIRILVIENSVSHTGAFRSMIAFTHALKEEVEFHFAVPRQSLLVSHFNGPVIQLPFLEVSRSVRAALLYFPMLVLNSWRIARYCKEQRIGIIHVNDLYNLCGVAVKWMAPGIKVVYHVRLMPDSYVRQLYGVWRKLINRYADRIICVSHAVRNAAHFASEKTQVIYNALPVAEFSAIPSPRKENADLVFLYLANYIHGKGQQYAIQAFHLLHAAVPHAKLIFAGSDMGLYKNRQYRQELMELCKSAHLQDKIIFYDFIPDVSALLHTADVLLNFSESESFSMTILEAMYAGVPVIATACGGPAELVEHGSSGYLVPVKDVQAMAAAMEILARDEALRNCMGEVARKRAREKFSIQESAVHLFAVYQALCE